MKLLAIVFFSIAIFDAFAQKTGRIMIMLPKTKIQLSKQSNFFILDVIDERQKKNTGAILLDGTTLFPIDFENGVERSLFEFWNYSVSRKSEKALPITITIKELSLHEKLNSAASIDGELTISLAFGWKRQETDVSLSTYTIKSNYNRSKNTEVDYSDMMRRKLTDALIHIDKWLLANEGKQASLVKTVHLTFKEPEYTDDADTLLYTPQRKLQWTDFKALGSQRSSRFAAAVFTSIAYEGHARSVGSVLEVEITIKSFLLRSMSWVKASTPRDAYALEHEQTHFDITRLMAERFKERLLNLELTVDDYDSQIQYQFIEAFRDMHKEQKRYDGDTQHGLNSAQQAIWNENTQSKIRQIYSPGSAIQAP